MMGDEDLLFKILRLLLERIVFEILYSEYSDNKDNKDREKTNNLEDNNKDNNKDNDQVDEKNKVDKKQNIEQGVNKDKLIDAAKNAVEYLDKKKINYTIEQEGKIIRLSHSRNFRLVCCWENHYCKKLGFVSKEAEEFRKIARELGYTMIIEGWYETYLIHPEMLKVSPAKVTDLPEYCKNPKKKVLSEDPTLEIMCRHFQSLIDMGNKEALRNKSELEIQRMKKGISALFKDSTEIDKEDKETKENKENKKK